MVGARPIEPLEETPANALAYTFVMSAHIGPEDDETWHALHHAVRGIGYFYVDLEHQTCGDCCPPGQN